MSGEAETEPTDVDYKVAQKQIDAWSKGLTQSARQSLSGHDVRALVDAAAWACAKAREPKID